VTDPQPQDLAPEASIAAGDQVTASLPLVSAELPIPAVPADELPALLESLLLVAPSATLVADLARGTGLSEPAVEAGLAALSERYESGSGFVLQRHGDSVQLTSSPRFAHHVRRFLKLDRETKLSTAALETLAIIAYQQPATRSEVDAVRGVDSSGVLATLHGRGLIEQVGRLPAPGNPVQYGTTAAFLRHFGLRSVSDLPPLGQVEGRDARGALAAAAVPGDPVEDGMAAAETPEAPGAEPGRPTLASRQEG
jgi:segregation and condensation protein B